VTPQVQATFTASTLGPTPGRRLLSGVALAVRRRPSWDSGRLPWGRLAGEACLVLGRDHLRATGQPNSQLSGVWSGHLEAGPRRGKAGGPGLEPPAFQFLEAGARSSGPSFPAARRLGRSHSGGLATISSNCVKWKPLRVVAGRKLSTHAGGSLEGVPDAGCRRAPFAAF
jgi:hypothetical protein